MKFIDNISKNEYIEFFNTHNTSFLQSYEWGQFCITGKHQKPFYVGLKDESGKVLCTTLLLKTNLPMGFSYFYAPRGFVIDFNNKSLLKEFVNNLKKFMKKHKAIYLKIDPEISYQDVDNNAEVVSNGNNNYELHNYLLSLGFKHQGFNKLYEKNQPRYTFTINLEEDYQDKMSKSFLKNIEKSKNYDLEFVVGNEENLKDFASLYQKTKERDNFIGYDLDYYRNFYKIFKKSNMTELFLIKLYPEKIIKTLTHKLTNLKKELEVINNENKKQILEKSISKVNDELVFFNKYKKEKEGIYVSAHMMVFCGNVATALYAGSDKDFQSTYANNFMYYEKIKYAKEKGYKTLDLFGTVGEPKTNFKNLAGIFEFKKNLGGKLIEFVGEYDLINNKFMYTFIKIAIPVQRKVKKLLKRK